MTTRAEQAGELARFLLEPARSRVLEALVSPGKRAHVIADLIRARRAPLRLAVLLALEAATWSLSGSVELGTPVNFCGWFKVAVFVPEKVVGAARLMEEAPGVWRLWALYESEDAARSASLSEALEVVRREVAEHLGARVTVWEMGP